MSPCRIQRLQRLALQGDYDLEGSKLTELQGAKKVVSDSPGLVDFAIGLVNSVLNLPDGQAKIFRRIKITKVL